MRSAPKSGVRRTFNPLPAPGSVTPRITMMSIMRAINGISTLADSSIPRLTPRISSQYTIAHAITKGIKTLS